jgi:hypothetical protein
MNVYHKIEQENITPVFNLAEDFIRPFDREHNIRFNFRAEPVRRRCCMKVAVVFVRLS